ncbi:MAG: 50S ribosomal protein L4 [Verrucomicrobiia bacterium]|jgi:large subunit ribosomal protein L4
MKVAIKDLKGNQIGDHQVRFEVIEDNRGAQAVHDVVVAYLANQRMGTACTKTMGEVAGTGKKPWRQKGTGRARAGSFQSPLWRGGGVVFGPKPRDFSLKINAKTKKLALKKALSERLKADEVVIVENIALSSPKTKEFINLLQSLNLNCSLLLVVETIDKNLMLASRNVPGIELTTARELNTYQTLRYEKILFTKKAFEEVENRLLETKEENQTKEVTV